MARGGGGGGGRAAAKENMRREPAIETNTAITVGSRAVAAPGAPLFEALPSPPTSKYY